MKNLYLVISATDWDYPYWASRHYISRHLADFKDNTVVFIERAPALISDHKSEMKSGSTFQRERLQKIQDRLYKYSPLPRFPYSGRLQVMSSLNQRLLGYQLSRLMERFRCDRTFIISFDYRAATLFRAVKGDVGTVYYVVDEISEFDFAARYKRRILREEAETIKAADLVIATSQPLLEKVLQNNRNSKTISHGVDIDIYLNSGGEGACPEDMQKIPGPIIGFMGKIESWVDIDLICSLSRRLPGCSFVLIGDHTVPIEGLLLNPNVYYLGRKQKDELPSYLQRFDIGLIPFRQNELVRNVNPLKLYEYLAAGLPVISTPMNAVSNYEHLDVHIAETPDDFEFRIKKILNGEVRADIATRVSYAASNSWHHKALELKQCCESRSEK